MISQPHPTHQPHVWQFGPLVGVVFSSPRGIAAWGFSYLPSSLFGAFVPRCQEHQMGMVQYRRLPFVYLLFPGHLGFLPFFLQIIGENLIQIRTFHDLGYCGSTVCACIDTHTGMSCEYRYTKGCTGYTYIYTDVLYYVYIY